MTKSGEIKLELMELCDYATVSQENKLSLIGLFDQIYVSVFPSQQPQMFVVGILTGRPKLEKDIQLSVLNPSGSEAIPAQRLKVILGQNGKTNLIANIGNLPLNEIGQYRIIFRDETEVLGEKKFMVFKTGNQSESVKTKGKFIN